MSYTPIMYHISYNVSVTVASECLPPSWDSMKSLPLIIYERETQYICIYCIWLWLYRADATHQLPPSPVWCLVHMYFRYVACLTMVIAHSLTNTCSWCFYPDGMGEGEGEGRGEARKLERSGEG